MYEAIQQRMADYDQEIMRRLEAMQREDHQDQPPPPVKNPQKARAIKKRGEEALREALYRMSGVDEGAEAFEQRYQDSRINALKTRAKELGFSLVQNTPIALTSSQESQVSDEEATKPSGLVAARLARTEVRVQSELCATCSLFAAQSLVR